jgi:hypothetical protein
MRHYISNSHRKSKLKLWLRFSCAIGLLVFFPSFVAIGENEPTFLNQPTSVFESLRHSTSLLKETTPRLGFQGVEAETVRGWLNSIDSNVSFLEGIAREQPNMQIPKDYTASLNLDSRLLNSITVLSSKHPQDNKRVYEALGDVASDLQIKVAYARSALGAAFRLVQVLVHTRKGDQEIGGYQVWYVAKGWADVQDEAKPFDRLSSPTYMDLPPGNYMIWTHKGQTNSKRQPVSLGDDGKSRREIDLPIQ